MLDQLERIEKRYQELNRQIAMPEVAFDLKQLQTLAQERASIEGLVTKYRQYKATSKSLEETRAMLSGGLDEGMTTHKYEHHSPRISRARVKKEFGDHDLSLVQRLLGG